MPNNNSEFNNGRALEGQFPANDILFFCEIGMPNSSDKHKHSAMGKQSVGNSAPIFNIDGNSVLRNIQTIIPSISKTQKMAIKAAWIALFNCMGWISLGMNALLALTGGIDEVKQWVLLVFTCVFALVKVYQIYQNAAHKKEEVRSRKLENDFREYELNLKKYNNK